MANKLSFIIKKDENAEPRNRYILSVKVFGKCVIAPRYEELNSALFEIPVWANEYSKDSVEYDIKVRL